MATDSTTHKLLKPDEAAGLLRRSKRTLARWRAEGIGPRYHKHGARILYPHSLLQDWVDQTTETPVRTAL